MEVLWCCTQFWGREAKLHCADYVRQRILISDSTILFNKRGYAMEFHSSHDTADPRYQFVLTEIELGITFIQRAETAYELGYEEHGNSAMGNAIKALASARCSIGHLDAEDQAIARKELPRLEEAIAALISEQPLKSPATVQRSR